MKLRGFDTAIRPLLVAEIGNNHEGSVSLARDLVHSAADCGADAVKFQTFRTELYVSRSDEARFARLSRFQLRAEDFSELADLARARGLLFLSTPFDLPSADVLVPLVDAFKIASGDNDFFPLIERVAGTGRAIVLSTGLSDFSRVEAAMRQIEQARPGGAPPIRDDVALLHCVSSYPVPPDQANLRAIATLRERFGLTVGYSDHTEGVDACVLAVALGAEIIEKHFTLDHHQSDFRDHQLSADPKELTRLAQALRTAAAMLGDGAKDLQACETETSRLVSRSICAVRDLEPGRVIRLDDLSWLRPGGGLAPGRESQVVGRRVTRPVQAGERLELSDLE